MSSSVINLLSGYFSEELDGARPTLRTSLINAGPEVVERFRTEFQHILSNRPMTHAEFADATMAWFNTDDELYAAVADAYRFFFDEEPPTERSERS